MESRSLVLVTVLVGVTIAGCGSGGTQGAGGGGAGGAPTGGASSSGPRSSSSSGVAAPTSSSSGAPSSSSSISSSSISSSSGGAAPELIIYPAPAGVPASPDFSVTANGRPVFVYVTPVNDNHFDYNATGQTLASVTYFDMAGTVTVSIKPTASFTGVDIRPKSLGITPKVAGGTISFPLSKPAKFTVELTGTAKPVDALHVFVSAPELNPPKQGDPGVTYFGPGIHDNLVGKINVASNQTVYIAGGAIVYGSIYANGDKITITGRGILTGGRATITGSMDPAQIVWDAANNRNEYTPVGQIVKLDGCTNTTVSGIVLLDTGWSITPHQCNGLTIDDVKIVNGGYTSDGIDVMQSQNVTIHSVFLRTWDDSIAMKALSGWSSGPQIPNHNINVSGTVHWNDWGGSLVFGSETQCAVMDTITWSDIDVIHQFEHGTFALHDYNQAAISNVTFKDIRVEDVSVNPYVQGFLFVDVDGDHTGSFSNLLFQNVTVNAPISNKSYLTGFAPSHGIQGVTFDNVVFNGTKWTDAVSANLTIGSNVTGVTFK